MSGGAASQGQGRMAKDARPGLVRGPRAPGGSLRGRYLKPRPPCESTDSCPSPGRPGGGLRLGLPPCTPSPRPPAPPSARKQSRCWLQTDVPAPQGAGGGKEGALQIPSCGPQSDASGWMEPSEKRPSPQPISSPQAGAFPRSSGDGRRTCGQRSASDPSPAPRAHLDPA